MKMLADHSVMATIPVKDLKVARKFYGETLGLKELDQESSMVLTYLAGSAKLVVYESQFAGTNQATSATWAAGDDIDNIVSALRAKGVKFEHYEFPGSRLEGDIHVSGSMKLAWFKDPDGNIHNLANAK